MRVKSTTDKWYDRRIWRDKLRPMVLARDPLCVICIQTGELRPMVSTVVDHIKAFATAATTALAWDLFTSLSNLRGICKRHHDEKTATQDCGFGNAPKKYVATKTIGITGGDDLQQFASSSLPAWQLDRALGGQKELDELLKDIPQ